MSPPFSKDVMMEHPQGQIFARIWGASRDEKTPIILWHDSLGCVELWRDFPAQLCRETGRRVIAYDRLGFGQSGPRSDILSPETFIADEASGYFPYLLQQLSLQDFIAFGHSVGGGMAINCAALFKEKCRALITLSAQTFAENKTLESIALAKEQFKDIKQLERLVKYHGDKARWVLEAWTESWLSPRFASWTLKEILPQVKSPTLAIHGIHDEYGSLAHPKMIGQLSSGKTQVEIMADTNHVPHREKPEIVLELVKNFLAGV